MPNIHESKIERIVLAEDISTTGKYWIALCQHLVKGFPCYDVVAKARTSDNGGIIIARHYKPYDENGEPIEHNKEHALAYWNEFRDRMTAPRGPSADDEPGDAMVVMKDGKEEKSWIN